MDAFAYRDWTGASYFLGALLLLAAAVALLFVSLGGGAATRAGAPVASGTGAGAAPEIVVRRKAVGRPFEVAGASFSVDANPAAGWASTAQSREAKPGQRWVVAAVEIVNHERRAFNPGLLSYLARGPRGALYAPVRAGVVGPSGLGEASGLPAGAGAEERLLFSLPKSLRHPVLAIQPSPTQPLEVRVPLRG
jgi:hypothetical protein